MSDLNLNFDTGTKSISLGNTSGSGNVGFLPEKGSGPSSPIKTIDLGPSLDPNLSVSDPSGFEMLTKGKNPDPVAPNSPNAPIGSNGGDSVRSNQSAKEEFSFFKPSEPFGSSGPSDTGGIVTGDLQAQSSQNPDEAIFMNKEQSEAASEFKPIHRLTPQDIKNE